MSAYVFFDILEITDQKIMQEYGHRIGPTVEDYGGRYLVRGGKSDIVEGDWHPVIPVIIEFPNLEQALCWLLDPSARFFGIGDVIFVRQ